MKFSIIMPSFNQKRFIERSIQSVLRQSYNNFELIIVDGASTDGTHEILDKYRHHCSKVLIEPDNGQSDALNKGFSLASGDVFGWLNSDDIYEPGAFQLAAAAFESHKNIKVFFGDWNDIDENDRVIQRRHAFDFSTKHHLYEGFHCNSQAMFWRKPVHRRFGKFDLKLHRTMDYEMILSFGENETDRSFLRTDTVLAGFRQHESQKTRGMDAKVIAEHKYIAEKHSVSHKFSRRGRWLHRLYRLRRFRWYVKRAGLGYALKKIIGSAAAKRFLTVFRA
ncbi:MAG TPA: glycosyltransferase [Rhodospirillaceae bacterium]|nr:glycosyltransferase [Rhodospirillaceae bacterium]